MIAMAILPVKPASFRLFASSFARGSLSPAPPEPRRQGYVGRLLRHVLGVMREDGRPLSSLWTPHPSLYRRYGWMVASGGYFYRFNPEEIAPAGAAPAAGNSPRIREEPRAGGARP